MSDHIAQALTKLFECRHIIFCYDAKKALFSVLNDLEVTGMRLGTLAHFGYPHQSQGRENFLVKDFMPLVNKGF